MTAIKGKDAASPAITEVRQSLARLSQNPNNMSTYNQMNQSHMSLNALNSSSILNRNSNIKKVIRGGNGSM